MTPITDTDTLKEALKPFKKEPFVTVDTEFVRERTYYPVVCLVQVGGKNGAVAVDTLAPGIDLTPLLDLMNNSKVKKVMHAAEQDVEIFYRLSGKIPHPLFDTQVAAQVLGYGETIGYAKLVREICDVRLDKTSRYTDWSHRPLSEAQISYALSDVTYLREVYLELAEGLKKKERAEWLAEEMQTLIDPARYENKPEDAWLRFKVKHGTAEFFSVLKALAEWRETRAQARDMPRSWVLRDDNLLEVAAAKPKAVQKIQKMKRLHPRVKESKGLMEEIVEAVQKGLDNPLKEVPARPKPRPETPTAMVDLLRVLLKMRCEKHAVARSIVASEDDLRQIAQKTESKLKASKIPAMQGWRYDVFGEAALALKRGEIALVGKKQDVVCIEVQNT